MVCANEYFETDATSSGRTSWLNWRPLTLEGNAEQKPDDELYRLTSTRNGCKIRTQQPQSNYNTSERIIKVKYDEIKAK